MSAHPYELPPSRSGTDLTGKWTDIFRSDWMVHLALMAAIVFGVFQGYLKDRIGGALPYALSDGAFLLAILIWFGSVALRRDPIRGPGAVPVILLAVILVPVFYLLAPGTPFLIKLAGLRSWSLFPMAALLGLGIVRNDGQVRAYVGLMLALGVVTGLYGIYQYVLGPTIVAEAGELALRRHGSTIYYSLGGGFEFRAFSTFTFPAPFAGFMVFCTLLAAAIATSGERPKKLRLLAALLIPLFFVGMTVSGTRAALIILLVGLLVLAWFRRLSLRQVMLIPLVLVALHAATVLTAGRIIERYRSVLFSEGLLWLYLTNPLRTAWESLAAYPFGLGLGRTGTGVPFAITSRMPQDYFVFTDGDVGRAAVELGIVGLALLALVIFGLIRYAPWTVRALRDTPADDVGMGFGAVVFATAVIVLIGSPFSSTPHGLIWWFFFGALLKLAMLESEERGGPEPATEPEGETVPEPPR
jgi:hypothetical protein